MDSWVGVVGNVHRGGWVGELFGGLGPDVSSCCSNVTAQCILDGNDKLNWQQQ